MFTADHNGLVFWGGFASYYGYQNISGLPLLPALLRLRREHLRLQVHRHGLHVRLQPARRFRRRAEHDRGAQFSTSQQEQPEPVGLDDGRRRDQAGRRVPVQEPELLLPRDPRRHHDQRPVGAPVDRRERQHDQRRELRQRADELPGLHGPRDPSYHGFLPSDYSYYSYPYYLYSFVGIGHYSSTSYYVATGVAPAGSLGLQVASENGWVFFASHSSTAAPAPVRAPPTAGRSTRPPSTTCIPTTGSARRSTSSTRTSAGRSTP